MRSRSIVALLAGAAVGIGANKVSPEDLDRLSHAAWHAEGGVRAVRQGMRTGPGWIQRSRTSMPWRGCYDRIRQESSTRTKKPRLRTALAEFVPEAVKTCRASLRSSERQIDFGAANLLPKRSPDIFHPLARRLVQPRIWCARWQERESLNGQDAVER